MSEGPNYVIPSRKMEALLNAIVDINRNVAAVSELLTQAVQQPYDDDMEPIEQEKDDGPTAAN